MLYAKNAQMEENPLHLQWQVHFPSENKEDLYERISN